MMKKFYLFLAMLLGVFGGNALYAQEAEHTFSRTETMKMSTVLSSFEPNTWYFMFQGRPYNGDATSYSLLNAGDTPSDDGGVLKDPGLGSKMFKAAMADLLADEGVSAHDYAAYAVKFVPVTGSADVYYIQFGTGNYMSTPSADGNSATFTTVDNTYDAGRFNIYEINAKYPGRFGFNIADYQQRVDNNGTSATVVTWGSGKRAETEVEQGNSIWHIVGIEWGQLEELEALLLELEHVWASHENDVEYFKERIGTNPGQYPEAEVLAFETAMKFGYDLLDETIELTEENMQKAIDDIKSTYEAVVAAKIPYIPADGYYRIRCGMVFTNNNADALKYMYTKVNGSTINVAWQTPEDLSTDGTVLWKLTKQDAGYDLVSVATDARFNNVSTSSAVTLSATGTNLMEFDVAAIVENYTYVNIRVATQNADDYYYLHAGGHSSGAGVSGNIVGWCRTYEDGNPAASEWVLEPVSEAEVQPILEAYELVKNREKMVADYQAMLKDAKSKLKIAKDQTVKLDEETLLITSAAQLHSPCSDVDEGKNIEYLLDNDATTFWHSDWHNNYTNEPHHWLQVEMVNDIPEAIAFAFTRRNNSGNQITQWSVYGLDESDDDLKQADLELLGTFDTPFNSQTETLVSDVFNPKGHKYLRFYCEATSAGASNSKFFHIAEFQLYPAQIIDPATSQYHMMGAVVTNLETVINAQAAVTSDNLTVNQYNALKTAYDAFIAKFVDPTPLRNAIAEAEGKVDVVAVGTDPGFWPEGSDAALVSKAVTDAKAYDAAGVYTAEQSQEFIDNLQGNLDNLFGSAIPVETGKWYRIRFGSADEFEEHGWGTDPGELGTITTYKEVKYETSEPLWDKYVVVADVQNDVLFSDDEGKVVAYNVIPTEAEKVTIGHNVRLDDEEDIKDAGLSYFRFVEVGDSAYALQNKATGLFIKAAGTDGAVTLDVIPSLFNVRPIGFGYNLLASRSLLKGANENYLHAQVSGNLLVTWDADALGTRSCLFIEEVEDVEATYEGTDFKLSMQPGTIDALCYPVNISAEEGLYGVNKVEVDAVKNNVKLSLASLQEVEAGRPFIIIAGDPTTYKASDDEQPVTLQHGYTFVHDAQADNLLKGTFTEQTVGFGVVVPSKNQFNVAQQSNTRVAAFHAWVAQDEKFDRDATASFVITSDADGIAASLQKLAKSGAIYTLDGRLVTKSGNLNSLRGMTPGIYIVNGVKVTIK